MKRKYINTLLIISLGLIILSSCKDEFEDISVPFVKTISASAYNDTSVQLTGEIIVSGGGIVEYGFVWKHYASTTGGHSCSLSDRGDKLGEYKIAISEGLRKNEYIWYQAYVKTDKYVNYGESLYFIPEVGEVPEITSITPQSGNVETLWTINGKKFSGSYSVIITVDGEYIMDRDFVSGNEITFKLPKSDKYTNGGTFEVYLKNPNEELKSPVDITVEPL
jgi:IPT/TIG domain